MALFFGALALRMELVYIKVHIFFAYFLKGCQKARREDSDWWKYRNDVGKKKFVKDIGKKSEITDYFTSNAPSPQVFACSMKI